MIKTLGHIVLKTLQFITISILTIGMTILLANNPGNLTEMQDTFPSHKVDEKPKLIKSVPPVYPEFAYKAGIEGMVIIRVVVDTEGNVAQANIMKSAPGLDQAALKAVKKWKFSPGVNGGKKVKVEMLLPVKFKIR